jgi:hypothetical protein
VIGDGVLLNGDLAVEGGGLGLDSGCRRAGLAHMSGQKCLEEKFSRPRKGRLNPNARRALEMLANDPATESIMLDRGFTRRMLTNLVSTGLAMPHRAPLKIGARTVEVTYITITAAGRRALEE